MAYFPLSSNAAGATFIIVAVQESTRSGETRGPRERRRSAGHRLQTIHRGLRRLGGTLVVTSEQGRDPLSFTATDMIRLELNLLGIRGARMNDMLVVLKLLGKRCILTRIAARFPLAPDRPTWSVKPV